NELFRSKILEKGRKLKASAGENYFVPAAMVAFTRFNFLMRRVFFPLMHQDINTIFDGVRELELPGVSFLCCRRAQFSADEPTMRLRMICQSWKVMFHAEYSSGQPLGMLVDLRAVVDAALAHTEKNKPASGAAPASRSKAAAASGNSSSTGAELPEFEGSSGSHDWDQNTSTGHPGARNDDTA